MGYDRRVTHTEVEVESALRENLRAVGSRMADAARRAGRDPRDVALVAVSKTQPPEVVAAAVRAGVAVLGENRVQEAAVKVPAVAGLLAAGGATPPRWHLVGHLQTNKARLAAQTFACVQSVDSIRVAEALNRHAPGPLPVLLEVYVGDDPLRPGFRPRELAAVASAILRLSRLEVRGLMTVAPLGLDADGIRHSFSRVRQLRDQLAGLFPPVHWGELSMGMSEDFETAIEEGSTMVRVGRALFGARNPGPERGV